MWVKICGITRLEDALAAAEAGASAVGFIFWPRSRRFIPPPEARAIAKRLSAQVTTVGVFVDAPLAYVRGVANHVRLGVVQLHGRESAAYCERVGLPVIKAAALGPVFDLRALSAVPPGATVLLDVEDRAARGGTGRTVDWAAARKVASVRRTILAGGLTPDNVADAIRTVRPHGVDVSSGVEVRPGEKDAERIRRFIEAAVAAAVGA
jgi:phosphoribosylanthranilate isomerase